MKTKFHIFGALILTALIFTGCNFGSTTAETLSIKTEPDKTSYVVGEQFDATGLVVTVTYSDSSTKDITYSDGCGITFKNTTFANSGSQDIRVFYDTLETTLSVTVNPAVRGIDVRTNPAKTSYSINDTFDPSGLVITVNYSNETTKDITYTADSGITLSAPDMTTAGTKKVTVTYTGKVSGGTEKNFTDDFNITVKEEETEKTDVTLQSIEVKTKPTKTSYYLNETFDASGLVITAAYSDKSTKDITYSSDSGITLSAPDMTTAGTKTITVTYLEKTATFDISILKNTVSSIAITTKPSKTSYYTGDELNTSGLSIKVTYADGTTETLTTGFDISGYDSSKAGTQTITVTCGEKTAEFTVTVTQLSVTSISISKKPSKIEYKTGDTVDTTGMEITAKYNSGKTEIISSGFTSSSPDMTTAGTKTVTVTYSGKTTTFNITVNEVSTGETSYKIEAETTVSSHSWYIAKINLTDFAGKTVNVSFSTKMKVINEGDSAESLVWTINGLDSDGETAKYTSVASHSFASGTTDWTEVSGSASSVILNSNGGSILYISTYNVTAANLTISLKDINLVVTEASDSTNTQTYTEIYDESGITTTIENSTDSTNIDTGDSDATTTTTTWLSDTDSEGNKIPSLYETYKDYFDYFGFAVEYGLNSPHTELYYSEIQNGLKKHANTISLGNEFKPDFVFNWGWWKESVSGLADFTASNGKTIKVPANIPTFTLQDEILTLCQTLGIHMRGHVLLWHSQTPAQFFYTNYGLDDDTTMVDAETMDARLEWYIKTVVQHCDTFTIASDGKPVIWAWDVANECTSDSSSSSAATSTTDSDWLRTSGSNWYTVYSQAKEDGDTNYYTGETYNSYDFVINAFRFANKYANANTKLVYNDYGGLYKTSTSSKHKSQLRLVQAIIDHENDSTMPTRIDAMGLQSHYSVQNSAAAYQTEIQDFVAKGLDVQITELDIATCADYNPETDTVGCSGKQFNSLADAYSAFMTMFINNRKTASKHGVSCVTIWGLSDEQTWLNTQSQRTWIGNCDQYPLLFNLINSGSSQTYHVLYNDGTDQATIAVSKKPSETPDNVIGYYETFDEGDSYSLKDSFWAVIYAAENYSE